MGLLPRDQKVSLGEGELVCPRQVIKMEVCFDKDALGHFFPTQLARVRLFEDASREPNVLPQAKIDKYVEGMGQYIMIKSCSYLVVITCFGKRSRRCLLCRSQLPVHFSRVKISVCDVTQRVLPPSSHTLLSCGISHKCMSARRLCCEVRACVHYFCFVFGVIVSFFPICFSFSSFLINGFAVQLFNSSSFCTWRSFIMCSLCLVLSPPCSVRGCGGLLCH